MANYSYLDQDRVTVERTAQRRWHWTLSAPDGRALGSGTTPTKIEAIDAAHELWLTYEDDY